jgi:hypothetical protein
MTMIDEDELRRALGEVAETIEVPVEATDQILAAATATMNSGSRPIAARGVIPQSRRARSLVAAAAAVLVVGGAILLQSAPWSTAPPRSIASTAAGPTSKRPVSNGGNAGAGSPTSRSPGFGLAQGNAGVAAAPSTGPPTSPNTIPPLPRGAVGQPAKVVTTGSIDLTISAGSIQSVVTKLTDMVTGEGGFVAKSDVQVGNSSAGDPSSGTVVLQVPQTSFGSLLAQVQKVAQVQSVSSTSTDVTGQYVDLQARIAALQASRQQYLTIMSRATSIGDVLAVQSQLDSLQSQIEQLQGQLDALTSQTTFGTLTVSLSEPGQHPVPAPHPHSGLSTAWHDSVSGFVSGFEWLVRIAGPILFVAICLAVLAVLGKLGWRGYRRRTL